MERWQGRVINAREVAELYKDKWGEWLLLEVIKMGKTGKAEEFKLLAHAKDKIHLHDHMDDDDWDWNKKYIFVFADPDSVCEL